jgi:hypothetical protein
VLSSFPKMAVVPASVSAKRSAKTVSRSYDVVPLECADLIPRKSKLGQHLIGLFAERKVSSHSLFCQFASIDVHREQVGNKACYFGLDDPATLADQLWAALQTAGPSVGRDPLPDVARRGFCC